MCARSICFLRPLLLLETAYAPISFLQFPLLGLADVQNVSLGNHVCAQNVHHEHFSFDRLKNKINR